MTWYELKIIVVLSAAATFLFNAVRGLMATLPQLPRRNGWLSQRLASQSKCFVWSGTWSRMHVWGRARTVECFRRAMQQVPIAIPCDGNSVTNGAERSQKAWLCSVHVSVKFQID